MHAKSIYDLLLGSAALSPGPAVPHQQSAAVQNITPDVASHALWAAACRQSGVVMQTEKRQQESLQRSIASELEWVNSNAKGQQKKGKARLRRYEDLTKQVKLIFSVTTA